MWVWIGDVSNAKLLGAVVIGCFSVLAIEIITKAIIRKNTLFPPNRSMLSGIRLLGSDYPAYARPRYVKAFVASVLFYIIIDVLLVTDFLGPSDVGKSTFARLSTFAFALLLPFASMMLSRAWVPIRAIVTSYIWAVFAGLTIVILSWKGWFGSVGVPFPRIVADGLSPTYLSNLNLRLAALIVSVLGAFVLVVLLRYDARFDKTVDLDYYRSYPVLNKSVSVFKETIKIYVPALFLGYGILSWPLLADQFGWAQLAPLPAGGMGLQWLPENHPYWVIVIDCSLVIVALKVFRCCLSPWEPYEIFVSYKSKNATTARHVSEQLIAADVKTWFAEYELLVKAQLKIRKAPSQVGEALIGKAIEQGVRGSKYGLAFTNDLYAESPYCEAEIRQLLSRCGPERVFEVMIPREGKPHAKFEKLHRCPSVLFQGDVDEVLTFLAKRTGWQQLTLDSRQSAQPSRPGAVGATYQGMCLGRPYTLDTCGWEITDQGGMRLGPGSEKGPDLRRTLQGGVLLMNLYFGVEVDPTTIRGRLNLDPDDRDIYDRLIVYASKHLSDLGAQVRGVHLLFHGDFSQFGLTYQLKGIWIRKWSVILASPKSNQVAEFVFTFGAFPVSFKEFCRHAHLMDSVVTSLRWS